MAELKARLIHGKAEDIQAAIDANVIDEYDVLFINGDDGKPQFGWVNRNGEKVIVANGADVGRVVAVEEFPETGETGVIYILANEGYVWNGTEFVNLCKSPDSLSIDVVEF